MWISAGYKTHGGVARASNLQISRVGSRRESLFKLDFDDLLISI